MKVVCLTLFMVTRCEGPIVFFTMSDNMVDRNLVNDVWLKYIPSKVSLFVWRLLHTRLPTKDNLVRRSIIPSTDILCTVDCGTSETATHFLGCRISNIVWHNVLTWLGISSVAPACFEVIVSIF